MNRMNRILEIDFPNRCAVVAAGPDQPLAHPRPRASAATTSRPTRRARWCRRSAATVSTNAGGPHCLKYGTTVNHVLGLQAVTGAGELVWLGGKVQDRPGYDLTGGVVGSEGTLGLVTAIIVRLLHVPEGVKTLLASFAALDDASEAVSAIIAAGIVPVGPRDASTRS